MTTKKNMRWSPLLAGWACLLLPLQAFALLPAVHRPGMPDELIKTVLTIHIFGIIFWIGGLGVRLFLLGSVKSATGELVRGQLFATQRRLLRTIEAPALIVALLAGLFLIYSGVHYYQRNWFFIKMLVVVGTVVLDAAASKQFLAARVAGKEGKATVLGVTLAIFAGIMVFASN